VDNGLVVALKASTEEIIRRVRDDENRPLLQGNIEEKVMRLLEARKHAYDFADIQIETTGLDVGQVADRIIQEYLKRRG